MKKVFFLFFILHLSLYSYAQPDTTVKYDFFKKYSIQEQQADLKILKTSLEKIHPGLYWYLTKQEFEKGSDSLVNSINSERTAYQFLDDNFILATKIRCCHTMANLSEEGVKFKKNDLPHFPLKAIVINNKLYIEKNFTDDTLFNAGTEIRSINGIQATDLIQKFIKKCHVDGHNNQGEMFDLSSHFDILTEYNFGIPSVYSVEVVSVSGNVIKKSINAVKWPVINDYQFKKNSNLPGETINIIDSLKTAVLTFNTFEDASYVTFLEQSFKTIKKKKIDNLIIDIRKNKGGFDDFGMRLYSYLALAPFKYYDHLEMTIDSLNDPIFRYGYFLEEGIEDFFDKNHSQKTSNGNYIIDKKKHSITADAPFFPKKNAFKGNVFILISGESVSGASEFSNIAHFNKRATFIGQETGGGYSGNTSGFNYIVRLPNTKIRFVIPVIRYLCAVDIPQDKGGVKPDYEIKPSVMGLTTGTDREMKFTIDLIKNK